VFKLRQTLAKAIQQEETASPPFEYLPELKVELPRETAVFIGHGRSKLWARLQVFLQSDLGLKTVTYESESRTSQNIGDILQQMMREATFGVLVMTAEDETQSGAKRARQNVIHEIGLFQGKLGFSRVVLLLQNGVEEFSNVAGLRYIGFNVTKLNRCIINCVGPLSAPTSSPRASAAAFRFPVAKSSAAELIPVRVPAGSAATRFLVLAGRAIVDGGVHIPWWDRLVDSLQERTLSSE
jgi:hypothetical protein